MENSEEKKLQDSFGEFDGAAYQIIMSEGSEHRAAYLRHAAGQIAENAKALADILAEIGGNPSRLWKKDEVLWFLTCTARLHQYLSQNKGDWNIAMRMLQNTTDAQVSRNW